MNQFEAVNKVIQLFKTISKCFGFIVFLASFVITFTAPPASTLHVAYLLGLILLISLQLTICFYVFIVGCMHVAEQIKAIQQYATKENKNYKQYWSVKFLIWLSKKLYGPDMVEGTLRGVK